MFDSTLQHATFFGKWISGAERFLYANNQYQGFICIYWFWNPETLSLSALLGLYQTMSDSKADRNNRNLSIFLKFNKRFTDNWIMLLKGTAQSSKYTLTGPEMHFWCFSVSEYGRQLCTSVQILTFESSSAVARGGSSFEKLMFYSIKFHFAHCTSAKMRNSPKHFRNYFLMFIFADG